MLSFEAHEPKFEWTGVTSVVDDLAWDHYGRSRSTRRRGAPPCKRWKPWDEELIDHTWPFDFDWNGLYCHDFPVLKLPDPVLLQVMRNLKRDDRRAMANTCTQLRELVRDNKSEALDRRILLGEWKIELCSDSSKIKVRYTLRDKPIDKIHYGLTHCGPVHIKTFNDLLSFEEHIEKRSKKYCYDKVMIYLPVYEKGKQEIPVDLDRILQVVGKFTYNIVMCFHKPDNSPVVVEQIFDAFFKNPIVKEIFFDFHNNMRKVWDNYRTTMRTRAETNGWAVRETRGRGRGEERCYRKKVEEGKTMLEILW